MFQYVPDGSRWFYGMFPECSSDMKLGVQALLKEPAVWLYFFVFAWS